jgi:NAD(P)-dependent dehydrogenase (short-subunit alcohol dehydrogenase family)
MRPHVGRSMERLAGKVALVTGGAQGVGKACCLMLAQEGAAVAVTDKQAKGKKVADQINRAGGSAKFYRIDVSKEASVKSVMGSVAKELGGIDVLVNNAGIIGSGKLTHELSEREWDAVQEVNVKGVFFCTKHALKLMRSNGGGSIINISSVAGIVGADELPAYHASKGAVRLMTKTDAMIYAKDGVRVNSIHPGAIDTPMLTESLQGEKDIKKARKEMAEEHPIGRVGKPEDIANAVVFLASDESSFITGEELIVDGGLTAH